MPKRAEMAEFTSNESLARAFAPVCTPRLPCLFIRNEIEGELRDQHW
jgi:hypothetical protein